MTIYETGKFPKEASHGLGKSVGGHGEGRIAVHLQVWLINVRVHDNALTTS